MPGFWDVRKNIKQFKNSPEALKTYIDSLLTQLITGSDGMCYSAFNVLVTANLNLDILCSFFINHPAHVYLNNPFRENAYSGLETIILNRRDKLLNWLVEKNYPVIFCRDNALSVSFAKDLLNEHPSDKAYPNIYEFLLKRTLEAIVKNDDAEIFDLLISAVKLTEPLSDGTIPENYLLAHLNQNSSILSLVKIGANLREADLLRKEAAALLATQTSASESAARKGRKQLDDAAPGASKNGVFSNNGRPNGHSSKPKSKSWWPF